MLEFKTGYDFGFGYADAFAGVRPCQICGTLTLGHDVCTPCEQSARHDEEQAIIEQVRDIAETMMDQSASLSIIELGVTGDIAGEIWRRETTTHSAATDEQSAGEPLPLATIDHTWRRLHTPALRPTYYVVPF